MPYPLDGEESESSEPTTRIRSSDMAQEVAEVALNASRAIPTMEDALRYASRQVTATEIAQRQFLTQTRHDWPRLGAAGSALERNPFTTPARRDPPRPEALMHPSDRPVVRRGPGSPLHSRPFRELLRVAIDKARLALDLWGTSDIEITEENKLEELAEHRADWAIHKELMRDMKLELEKAQAQLSQAVVVMNNLTIDAVLREVTLTEAQRQQIFGMKYER